MMYSQVLSTAKAHTQRTNIKSIAPSKGIRIPESGKFLRVEFLILGFGIRNITPEFKSH